MEKKLYIGKGTYIPLKAIAVIMLKNFSKGFKSEDGKNVLRDFFWNKGFHSPELRNLDNSVSWSNIWKRLYQEGFLEREIISETKGKYGKFKRRYFYKVNLEVSIPPNLKRIGYLETII